jgi:hypothetical protein
VRAAQLGDLGTERFEQLHRLGEPAHHAGLVSGARQVGDDADPHAAHVAVPRRRYDGRNRCVDRRGVERIVPRHRLVQQRGIKNISPERSRGV